MVYNLLTTIGVHSLTKEEEIHNSHLKAGTSSNKSQLSAHDMHTCNS